MITYPLKYIPFLLSIIVCINNVHAQSGIIIENVPQIQLQDLLAREQLKVLGNENTMFGNFASIQTKDNILTFNGNIPMGEKNSLSLSLKGGATEGIVSIFDGTKVNSNVSIGLQYNLGIYGKTETVEADATKLKSYKKSIDSLNQIIKREELKISNLQKAAILKQKQLREKEDKIKARIKTIQKNKKSPTQDKISIDSLELELESLKIEKDHNDEKVRIYNFRQQLLDEQAFAKELLRQKETKLLEKIESAIQLTAYKLKWISFFAKLNNRTFNQFKSQEAFEDQVINQRTNNFELGINGNLYIRKDQAFSSFYASLAISYENTDNFKDLSESTLTDKQDFNDGQTSRTNTTSRKVYSGEYDSSVPTMKTSLDMYWFLTSDQKVALHLNPYILNDFDNINRKNLIIGLFLAFTDKSDKKNIINTEIFFERVEETLTIENPDEKYKPRFGFRTTFPINFK